MLAQVEGVVKSAIGFDATRGDVVTVENIPFFQPDENLSDELAKAAEMNALYRYGALSVPILALLIFGFFVLRPMMKFLTSNPEAEIDITRLLPQGMQVSAPATAQGGLSSAGAAGIAGPAGPSEGFATPAQVAAAAAAARGLPDLSGTVDMEQLGEIMSESSRLVKENPAQAALLIRYWLNEGHL
jgi:flagellar M-ring protein FliF